MSDPRLPFLDMNQQFALEKFRRDIKRCSKEQLEQVVDTLLIHCLTQDNVTKSCYKKELRL